MTHQQSLILLVAIVAATLLSVQGKLECEELPIDLCAFSVSSAGQRCVLETTALKSGDIAYECQTSVVETNQFAEWVETDDCVKSCGLERMSVGMSSDALVEKAFAKTLSSDDCQQNCPNVIDLFTKLASGEGVSLPQVCKAQRSQSRRMMADFSILASQSQNTLSAWPEAAPSPLGSKNVICAPAPAPSQA